MFNRLQMKIINIKNKIHRAKHGYSYSDVWNMFDWFLEVMPPMLTKLRDEGISYPVEFDEREDWGKVLTTMIDCLKVMSDEESNTAQKNFAKDRFFMIFSNHFYDLWD